MKKTFSAIVLIAICGFARAQSSFPATTGNMYITSSGGNFNNIFALTGTGANTFAIYPFYDGNTYLQHDGNVIFSPLGTTDAHLMIGSGGKVGVNSTVLFSTFQVDDFSTKLSLGSAGDKGAPAMNYGTAYMGFNAARFDSGSGTTQSWLLHSDGANNGGGAVWGDIFGDMYFAPIASTGGHDPQTLSDSDMPSRVALKIGAGGTVYAKQIIVRTAAFPDYVFKKDYRLRPLSAVKSYIDQNHHLPEMPAAPVVEKDGMDVAEMNKILLKKVEELTLYLIEKDNQQQRQEIRLQKLEKALKLQHHN